MSDAAERLLKVIAQREVDQADRTLGTLAVEADIPGDGCASLIRELARVGLIQHPYMDQAVVVEGVSYEMTLAGWDFHDERSGRDLKEDLEEKQRLHTEAEDRLSSLIDPAESITDISGEVGQAMDAVELATHRLEGASRRYRTGRD